jgi:hypothetical protein
VGTAKVKGQLAPEGRKKRNMSRAKPLGARLL